MPPSSRPGRRRYTRWVGIFLKGRVDIPFFATPLQSLAARFQSIKFISSGGANRCRK